MTFWTFPKGRREPPPPDPAQYQVPSSIGSGPKWTLHQRHKPLPPDCDPEYSALPSTLSKKGSTIGPRIPVSRAAQHTASPELVTTTVGGGAKPSIHDRHAAPMNENPGPGSYQIPDSFDGPRYTCGTGKRNTFIVDNMYVPPGGYSPSQPLDQRRPATIARRFKEPFQRSIHPGPIYETVMPIGAGARKTGFPRDPRFRPIPQTPGPGDYDHLAPFGRGSQLSSRMRPKSPVKEPERNRMPYYDLGSTISPSRKSHLKRPITSYETMSPGPHYDVGTTVVPKPKTIGIRHLAKDPRQDNPSPDSYWMAETPPKPPPIAGILGPEDRCPVNLAHEAQKPGPGYYEQPDLMGHNRRGYPFTSRPDTSVHPDTAAPYHGPQSTLGGPMYTIGLKDV